MSSQDAPETPRPRRVQVRVDDTWLFGYVWDWSVDHDGTWWVHVWCRDSAGELPHLRTFRRAEVMNAQPDV